MQTDSKRFVIMMTATVMAYSSGEGSGVRPHGGRGSRAGAGRPRGGALRKSARPGRERHRRKNSHQYYMSEYYPVSPPGGSHWEDMSGGDAKLVVGESSPPVHHKQNKPVSLSFDFKFYGHFIRNISISTRGYINTGPYPSYVTDTQYVAPLSDPRLDSSLDKYASVRYKDSGTSFTVEWNRLYLTNQTELGPFIFQTTLMKDGRIVFAYKEAPARISDDTMRDVKVGVSDAYIPSLVLDGDKPVIEYHRVELGLEKVHSNAVVILVPLQSK
uniref:Uncharacterized protein n=1 Tax=Branchiostoma floridae TaxID=7739 RepID=C3ZWM4_BRAFL|eukprot:XP_002587035.1 hypothetical protein BRAFLDRAFT_122641 [Branchiostoma floridae]